jgi:hypothetical protein
MSHQEHHTRLLRLESRLTGAHTGAGCGPRLELNAILRRGEQCLQALTLKLLTRVAPPTLGIAQRMLTNRTVRWCM